MDVAERSAVFAALGDPGRLATVDALAVSDMTVTELAQALTMPTNLLAHHLRVLEAAGLIERHRSEGDGRRRYVTLLRDRVPDLRTHPLRPTGPTLFVCTANSARSQFAAAMWKRRSGLAAQSAGSAPAARVNPVAVRVAAEFGLDLAGREPAGYESIASAPELVISVCDRARESSPPEGGTNLHWSIPDPVPHGSLSAFRRAFQQINDRIAGMTGATKDTNTNTNTNTKENNQ